MNDEEFAVARQITLVISKEKAAQADQILNSLYGPLTANLGLNISSKEALARRGMVCNYAVDPYIPTARKEQWVVICRERAEKMLFMAWAWKPRLDEQVERRKGVTHSEASTFFGPVAVSWQCAFGSLGDNSAITS